MYIFIYIKRRLRFDPSWIDLLPPTTHQYRGGRSDGDRPQHPRRLPLHHLYRQQQQQQQQHQHKPQRHQPNFYGGGGGGGQLHFSPRPPVATARTATAAFSGGQGRAKLMGSDRYGKRNQVGRSNGSDGIEHFCNNKYISVHAAEEGQGHFGGGGGDGTLGSFRGMATNLIQYF